MEKPLAKAHRPVELREGVVRPLPFAGDDAALVLALRSRHPGAMEALYDRYAKYVERVLVRIVNVDMDLAELLHEVFIQAFSSIHKIRDGRRLRSWLATIAVFTARKRIKRRFRRLDVWYPDTDGMPELETAGTDPEAREALHAVYRVLDSLPVDERIAFALRFIEGMALTEVAAACRVSLATAKRRLYRGRERFFDMAQNYPLLQEWIDRGDRREVE